MREKYLSFMFFLLVAAGCRDSADKSVTVVPGVSYSNGTAGQQVVNLPDGSHVTIGSGTVIVASKGFGKEGRDVEIDGEGMFEVAGSREPGASAAPGTSAAPENMGSKPFVVHTGNLIIEVLDTNGPGRSGANGSGAGGWGSRFAVDAVRKRAGEEVDLLGGRLRVTKSYHSDTDSLPEELTAGDMVMINREIDLMEKEKKSGPEEDKVKEKFHLASH